MPWCTDGPNEAELGGTLDTPRNRIEFEFLDTAKPLGEK
jgi:hypothetical protein